MPREVGAQPGELLPAVARHLGQHRALAVDDLVVADRQHEVLAVGVDHREGHLVVVVLAVDRLQRRVVQRVVHPAHVPLQAEAEAAHVGRRGDATPARRLLGHRDDAGRAPVDRGVRLLQELDRVEVLPAAVLVRQPLPVLARVVEVEHRGHRVDAQAVDVELLQPVAGVGDEEVAHLRAAEVEDVGAPLGVLAAAGVRVLVEGWPSKRPSAKPSLGKCAGTQSTKTPMPAWCSLSTR
jgi:hypothetical protein